MTPTPRRSVNNVAGVELCHVFFISALLLLFPCLLQTHVDTSWPKRSNGSNLSSGAWLRSPPTSTLFGLDPGDQIAADITCYFCTVAVDRTLGLQLSATHVELSFCRRAATVEFRVFIKLFFLYNKEHVLLPVKKYMIVTLHNNRGATTFPLFISTFKSGIWVLKLLFSCSYLAYVWARWCCGSP